MPSLPRPGKLKLRRDAGGALQVTGAPDASPLILRATIALGKLTEAAAAPGAKAVDVQPIVQVCGAAGYARWRADRETAWRAHGGRYTTAAWPAKLGPEDIAAVLLPLPLGATSGGSGRKAPRVVADPLFSSRSTSDGSGPDDLATGLISEWLHQATQGPRALRVAAPIVEAGDTRRVLTLGIAWPL
jgi:hypothetical protein